MHLNSNLPVQLLIIGAGPYGLSTAAYAKARGVDTHIVGRPMQFWRDNMPSGMFLRSSADWHIDPLKIDTFLAFLKTRGLQPSECDPIPLSLFLDYATWFQERKALHAEDTRVKQLQRNDDRLFEAQLEDGRVLTARNVLCAPGMGYFQNIPPEYASLIGKHPEQITHSSQLGDLRPFEGDRCVIIGGRQSAFETAALLAESGAREVHVVHRHPTPSFEPSDWTFVEPMMESGTANPAWFRSLSAAERDQVTKRFWSEGRLKLEPWLTPRLRAGNVQVHENAKTESIAITTDGAFKLHLDNGETLQADRIILATGFKPDISRIPYLAPELCDAIATNDGFPALSPGMESSVPGLYFTGLCAARDFGPFFGFIRACNLAASIVIDDLLRRLLP